MHSAGNFRAPRCHSNVLCRACLSLAWLAVLRWRGARLRHLRVSTSACGLAVSLPPGGRRIPLFSGVLQPSALKGRSSLFILLAQNALAVAWMPDGLPCGGALGHSYAAAFCPLTSPDADGAAAPAWRRLPSPIPAMYGACRISFSAAVAVFSPRCCASHLFSCCGLFHNVPSRSAHALLAVASQTPAEGGGGRWARSPACPFLNGFSSPRRDTCHATRLRFAQRHACARSPARLSLPGRPCLPCIHYNAFIAVPALCRVSCLPLHRVLTDICCAGCRRRPLRDGAWDDGWAKQQTACWAAFAYLPGARLRDGPWWLACSHTFTRRTPRLGVQAWNACAHASAGRWRRSAFTAPRRAATPALHQRRRIAA